MAELQRKIELQSIEDLSFLVGNIRRGANEKINEALPPVEGEGEDAMRKRVEEDAHAYVNKVFQLIGPNITINGLSPDRQLIKSTLSSTTSSSSGVIEEHEPFNHKLFEKAKDNARQEEDLIEEIAALRRKVPTAVVEKTKKKFKDETEADDEALGVVVGRMEEAESEARIGGTVLGVGSLERQEGVERNWSGGVKGLERVMDTLPEVVARCQRAGKAEEYVNGMHGN
ncbi:hypothetical protein BJ875DRAFT_114193 [Amylocarpus encephaloides]|uniref:Kinetochore protein mis14 n=1 Tax=Amylocarpus encephaloides TaxID=45428 RepID=A0A9P7YQ27_9HELO|nr:hypothetical protein BJ875DRAFT_114193 [Amylocarpus encephaloides]